MASQEEIKQQLSIALSEIGDINPWYDKDVEAWIFSHPLYPVEYAGDSKKDVIKNYPVYLQDFIEERLEQNLSAHVERSTKGWGGYRKGAGRPHGSTKESKKRIYLPTDIADWAKDHVDEIRELKEKIS